MKISVFGIGYVGAVTSACLADSGHEVIAVDVDSTKVKYINEGCSPVTEQDLDTLIAKNVQNGHLRATENFEEAIRLSDISLICVGTPSNSNGSLDLSYITSACEEIGKHIGQKAGYHTVAIRSTVLPGTLRNVVKPILEGVSGRKAGQDFGLGNNPEFLREGNAIADYYTPTQIVVGALDKRTAETIMSLYNGIEAPRSVCDPDVAEGVKYVSNAWRATKIGFANEMGNILKSQGVDSHEVMNIIFKDTKINLGPSFLMPGFAFGGSCLPKDVRAMRSSANDRGVKTPVFDSLLMANTFQVERAFEMIKAVGKQRVALLGLSFKPGTDDLRESPLVTLAEMLLENGYALKIYDPCVRNSLQMKNAAVSPVLSCIAPEATDILKHADLFVIGHNSQIFRELLKNADPACPIIDLVRLKGLAREKHPHYSGICW